MGLSVLKVGVTQTARWMLIKERLSEYCRNREPHKLIELGLEEEDDPTHDLAVAAVPEEDRHEHVGVAASVILKLHSSMHMVAHCSVADEAEDEHRYF